MTDTEKYSLGNVAWGFPADNLGHARAETSQPTPTEQLRAIAQAETAYNMCDKNQRMRRRDMLNEAQSNADFPAILAHVEALEERAERAEHFVRIIAGLRPGHIGESEAGQLVRTAQATLQPITPEGTQ